MYFMKLKIYGRFMAEVPNAHDKRVQALLGWLVQCQGGLALPFLLPGLLQCSQPDADSLHLTEPGTHKRWQEALLRPQARLPSFVKSRQPTPVE